MTHIWAQTLNGKAWDFERPDPSQVEVGEIVVSLSRQPRFNGHTRRFYSVADHSLACLSVAGDDPLLRMAALVHDFAEAYYGDIIEQVHRLCPGLRYSLAATDEAVRIGLWGNYGNDGVYTPAPWYTPELADAVKEIDLRMLATERADLMAPPPLSWGPVEEVEPYDIALPFTPGGHPAAAADKLAAAFIDCINAVRRHVKGA